MERRHDWLFTKEFFLVKCKVLVVISRDEFQS